MKKLFLVIILFSISIASYSQKSKSKKIYSNSIYYYSISENKFYDEKDSVNEVEYFLTVRDSRYSSIVQLFTLHNNSLDGLYDFVNYLKEFLAKEDDGTSTIYRNHSIHIYKSFGTKVIRIYGKDRNDSKCTDFMAAQLNKISSEIKAYATKNNIQLTEEREEQ